MSLRIQDVPEHERPRERLLARGVEVLSERELLALVLRNGRQGESALDVAGALISEFGSLQALASALPEELARRPSVGPAKAAALVAAFRLGRLAASGEPPPVLRSAADVAAVAMRELAGARRERVIVLVCDAANRLRRVVAVGEGAVDRSLFPVREILNAVLRHDGRAFAVAHNHPAGNVTPTEADYRASVELEAAAGAVGIRLLDHVVVTATEWATATRRTRG